MKVLKNWEEVGSSINALKVAGLPLHTEPVKCWDFNNIQELFVSKVSDKNSLVVDLGCGPSLYGCMTLGLLRCLGYKNLIGIDFHIPFYTRLAAMIRGWKKNRTFNPYRMVKGDITAINLSSNSVDAALLLSFVEHGADLENLFHELHRIMKAGR